MPGLNQSGEVITIPPYILPASSAGAWECVVNWPVVFQCGGVGFVTVQRRCRLTYLFPAGATPRRPAEQLPAQSPPPPARRDPIGAATDGAAGAEWILRRCRSGCWSGHGRRDHCTAPMARDPVRGRWPRRPAPASPAAAPRRRATPPPRIATYRAQHCVAPISE